MSGISIVPIDRLELRFAPRPWPFAEANRAAIDAHFAKLRRANPALWNGRILMLHDYAIAGPVFRGSFIEVDYASFLVWREWGWPEAQALDCFAQAVLRSADGAVLLGVMGRHTANPGRVYFPGGTPDRSDLVGSAVDLDGSMRREVLEETGLAPLDYTAEPGWHTVLAGPLIAHLKTLHIAEDADTLRARILAFLARERTPELSDIRIVRGPADLEPMMPDFVHAYLIHMWARPG